MEREDDSSDIDRLLQEGVSLYDRGMEDQAIAVWSEVLHIQPDEPRAREYLRSAGVHEDLLHPASPIRVRLEKLLAERRYEEALDFLHQARWQTPDAPEISRGIVLLKERLVRRYLHRVGNLDSIPRAQLSPDDVSVQLTEEERSLLRLVDGISSFGDIAHESRLGRFETYRALARFMTDGVVIASGPNPVTGVPAAMPLAAPAPVTSAVTPSAAERAARPRRWANGVVISVAVLIPIALAAVAAVALLRAPAASSEPETAAAMGAATAAPTATVPAPATLAVARDAAAPDAMTAADAAPAAVVEPGLPAVDAETEAPGAKPRPPRPRKNDMMEPPVEAAPPPAPAVEPPAPVPAASLPVPEPAPAPAHAPAPAPVRPVAALDGDAVTGSLTVKGPLPRAVVERAVARVSSEFGACYTTAARSAQHNAAGAVQVWLTIDESGRARDVTASDFPLPGLSGCVRDLALRIRSQAPDVGVASISFTVTFTPKEP